MAVKRLLPAGFLLLCAVPAVIINTPLAYVPLVFCILLGVASTCYTLVLAYSCMLTGPSEERRRCERETCICYPITIRNRGPFPAHWVTLSLQAESMDGLPPLTVERQLMLRPGEMLALELPMTFPHIGQYEVKVSALRFHGLLGMLALRRRPCWYAAIQVTPKLFRLPKLKIHTARPVFAVEHSVSHQMDGGEYADIRPYAPGDPIKNIHWKLSAHSDGYISRTFRTDAVSGASVYLDMRPPAHLTQAEMAAVSDCLIESAYAVAAHALSREYGAELVYAQRNTPTAVLLQGGDMMTQVAYALRPISAAERYPVERLVEEHTGRANSLDHIFVITSTVSKALVNLLSSCCQRGKRTVLLHVYGGEQPSWTQEDISVLASSRAIAYHVITSASELADVLEVGL